MFNKFLSIRDGWSLRNPLRSKSKVFTRQFIAVFLPLQSTFWHFQRGSVMTALTQWHFPAGLASPFYLNFRVRFFISDPNSLQHEQTRCALLFALVCFVLYLASTTFCPVDELDYKIMPLLKIIMLSFVFIFCLYFVLLFQIFYILIQCNEKLFAPSKILFFFFCIVSSL